MPTDTLGLNDPLPVPPPVIGTDPNAPAAATPKPNDPNLPKAPSSVPSSLPPPPMMVQPTLREKLVGGFGQIASQYRGENYENTPIGRMITANQQQRLADAQRHYSALQTYGTALGSGPLVTDPQTGQMAPQGVDPETHQPMTPEQRAYYMNLFQGALQDYQKSSGVSKESKQAAGMQGNLMNVLVHKGIDTFKKVGSLIRQHQQLQRGQGQPQQPAQGGGSGGGGMPAPPQAQGPNASLEGGGIPAPPAYNAISQLQAPRLAARMQAREQGQLKVEEQEAELRGGIETRKSLAPEIYGDDWQKNPEAVDWVAGPGARGARSAAEKPPQRTNWVSPEGTPLLMDATGSLFYKDEHGDRVVVPGDQAKNATEYSASHRKSYFNYVGSDNQEHRGYSMGDPPKPFTLDGTPMDADPIVFSAWMQGKTTNTWKTRTNPDGSQTLVPVTVTETRGKGTPTPAAAAPAAGATAPAKGAGGGGGSAAQPPAGGGGRKEIPFGGKPRPELVKAYEDFNASQKRYRVMQDSMAKLRKDPHDQQAMINLLANHLGMTAGLQKGARISQAMWNEAMNSTPWLDGLLSRFTEVDPKTGDRVVTQPLRGVVLTPLQERQMVDLAQSRLVRDRQGFEAQREEIRKGYGMFGQSDAGNLGTSTAVPSATGGAPSPPAGPAPKTWEELKRQAAGSQ